MRGTWQTTDGGGGGGLVLAVVIIAAAALGSGTAAAAVTALVTIGIVIACLATVAVLGSIALIVCRARSDRSGRPIAARSVYQLPPEVRPQLSSEHKRAIEPPRNEVHLHFHGMSPAEVAEAIRQADGK